MWRLSGLRVPERDRSRAGHGTDPDVLPERSSQSVKTTGVGGHAASMAARKAPAASVICSALPKAYSFTSWCIPLICPLAATDAFQTPDAAA